MLPRASSTSRLCNVFSALRHPHATITSVISGSASTHKQIALLKCNYQLSSAQGSRIYVTVCLISHGSHSSMERTGDPRDGNVRFLTPGKKSKLIQGRSLSGWSCSPSPGSTTGGQMTIELPRSSSPIARSSCPSQFCCDDARLRARPTVLAVPLQ